MLRNICGTKKEKNWVKGEKRQARVSRLFKNKRLRQFRPTCVLQSPYGFDSLQFTQTVRLFQPKGDSFLSKAIAPDPTGQVSRASFAKATHQPEGCPCTEAQLLTKAGGQGWEYADTHTHTPQPLRSSHPGKAKQARGQSLPSPPALARTVGTAASPRRTPRSRTGAAPPHPPPPSPQSRPPPARPGPYLSS